MASAYVVYKKTSDSKFYLVSIETDDSVTAIAELPELVGHNIVRILTDSSGNVYALKEKESTLTYTWHKYNSSGVLQATKVLTGSTEMFGFIASDGYLYTMKFNGYQLYKRSLTTLETEETISLTSAHRYYYLCFDSNGYLYTYDRDYAGGAAFVKWEIGTGVLESHTQGLSSLSAWADFALLGTTIAHDYRSDGVAGTLATSLDSDMAVWTMDDIPNQVCGAASNTSYWFMLGENTADDALIVEKYNSSKTLISTITVSSDYITGSNRKYTTAITAYPFAVAIVTTLAPTMVEDGIANLKLELVDKGGLTIYPVGWYCDENAAPSTEYIETGWYAGVGGIDLALGEYSKYVKTLPTGETTLYVQAWCDDSDDNRYLGEILSFEIPQAPEYWEFPDINFPEFPEFPEWELPDWEWNWEIPEINFNLGLDLYLDRTYTRKDLDDLRRKCVNYEKNYTDYCLVLNHNTLLVKNFLQSVYNNGVLAGESEMFAKVFPSQQLTPLYLEPLEPEDFKGIINRFIDNNTANAMGLNHNFNLFTTWLNDYNYTADGYKASHINPKEGIITNDEPTVKYMKAKVDKIQKEVSTLSREIAHNFNLIKEIIQ